MADPDTVRELLAFIAAVPPRVHVTLWSGIPCTGGSSWQNVNKKKFKNFAEKAKKHEELFIKLFVNFKKIANAVCKRQFLMTFQ